MRLRHPLVADSLNALVGCFYFLTNRTFMSFLLLPKYWLPDSVNPLFVSMCFIAAFALSVVAKIGW